MTSQIKKNRHNHLNRVHQTHGTHRVASLQTVQGRQEDQEANDYDGDSWNTKEYGEEYRYARPYRPSTAKAAYQKSLALIHQKATHAPFYLRG